MPHQQFPGGVASQKEALRKRFTGIPEHVVNFLLRSEFPAEREAVVA